MLNIMTREVQIKTSEIPLHIRMAIIKEKSIITILSKDGEKLEPSYIDCGHVNGAATVETLSWFLKKLNIELPDDPEILFVHVNEEDLKVYVHTKSYT